jgi:integrase/recombinase XerD
MDPDAIDRLVRKVCHQDRRRARILGQSMRATFITTALENGAQFENMQRPFNDETL